MNAANPTLDRLADAVAERLLPALTAELAALLDHPEQDAGLIGPAELARRLGRSPDWVRQHADELGVIRLGDGTKPRMYFDPELVTERLRQEAQTAPPPTPPTPTARHRNGRTRAGAALLPVREP